MSGLIFFMSTKKVLLKGADTALVLSRLEDEVHARRRQRNRALQASLKYLPEFN